MFTQEAMRAALIFTQTENHKIALRNTVECAKSPVKDAPNQNSALNNTLKSLLGEYGP